MGVGFRIFTFLDEGSHGLRLIPLGVSKFKT